MLSFPIALLGSHFTEEWKTFKFEQLEEADRKGLETGGVKHRVAHTPAEIATMLRRHILQIDKVLLDAKVRESRFLSVTQLCSADASGGDEEMERGPHRSVVQEQGRRRLAESKWNRKCIKLLFCCHSELSSDEGSKELLDRIMSQHCSTRSLLL